jgi:hypothetical protein
MTNDIITSSRLEQHVLLFVAGISFFASILLFVGETRRELLAQRVQGTVIEFRKINYRVLPIIEYTVNGNTYETWSGTLGDVGDEFTVLYWNNDPSNGRIKGANYPRSLVLFWFGIVFMIARQRRRANNKE